MEAFETYLIRERGHTPRGARRYAYDVRWWEAWLAGRSPTGTGCAGAPTGRSPSGPGEPGTPKGRSPAGQPEGCAPKSREASAAMVRAFLAEKGLSARRTQGFLAALRAYYRWRKEVRGEAVEDPTAPVARPRAGRRIPRHPSREDLERLLGGVEGEPEAGLLKALLRFLYGTGLRLSEAVGLDLESLIFEEEDDPLRDSRTAVHRRKPVALRVIGKGDKERLVPLSPLAQAGLEEWLALRGKHQGALFVYREGRRRGHRVGVSWLQKKLKGLALRVGLDPRKASPHKFRHAYATELVNAGVGLDAIKELLGHASIATTQIYAHTSYRRLQEAAGRLL